MYIYFIFSFQKYIQNYIFIDFKFLIFMIRLQALATKDASLLVGLLYMFNNNNYAKYRLTYFMFIIHVAIIYF